MVQSHIVALIFLTISLTSFGLVNPHKPKSKQVLDQKFVKSLGDKCPKIAVDVYGGVPTGRFDGDRITYNKSNTSTSLEMCVKECCESTSCQISFVYQNRTTFTCYLADCSQGGDQFCLPTPSSPSAALANGSSTSVILVRPLHSSWDEVFSLGVGVTSKEENRAKITVQVASKNITLPTDFATLTAYAIPEAPKGKLYDYEWTLVSGQGADGAVMNKNGSILKLSKLKLGRYDFNVTVKGKNAFGEATGYVQVVKQHVNIRPPKAVVVPKHQVVNLPTKKAIIDASGSTVDSGSNIKELKFKWQLEKAVLAYSNKVLPETATLTLDDLIAGNYTVRLTVTDSDGATDTALSYLTVTEGTDYPPTANAGEDVVIYLPTNTVDLHGNGSSDDHGIASWEWTRSGGKNLPAADMTNSRDPILHLSNLEEGTYRFILTVKDGKGQQGEDDVNVYVKPPSNLPPKADAGQDGETSLPNNWILLDGTKSQDDVGVTSFLWEQSSDGPNEADIVNSTNAVANATGLTKGNYVFKLKVGDGSGNFDEASVKVIVKQDTNAAPVAMAGKDMTVTLPQTVVLVDGSGSNDDLRIVRWRWTRLPDSLAAGTVLGDSGNEQVLRLTNLVPGQYLFQLQVWDDQGKSSVDSVSVNVRENDHRLDIVEAVLNEQLVLLTTSRLDNLFQSLNLLLSDGGGGGDGGDDDDVVFHRVEMWRLYPQPHTGNTVIQFVIQKKLKYGRLEVMKGLRVVQELRKRLKLGQDVLKVQFLELDTLYCQNDCSGHGTCQQATRECVCQPFWMENIVRRRLMDGERNCEWSVIYVGISVSIAASVIVCGTVQVLCARRAVVTAAGSKPSLKSRSSRSKERYKQLSQQESRNFLLSNRLSDSETDSDDDEDESMKPLRLNGGRKLTNSDDSFVMSVVRRSKPQPFQPSDGNVVHTTTDLIGA